MSNYQSIEEFVKTIPKILSLEKIEKIITENPVASLRYGLSVDRMVNTWAVHDAIHYVTGLDFSYVSEQKIRYIEEELNIGWYAVSPELYDVIPIHFDCSDELIGEILSTSEKLKKYMRPSLVET
jgi:hypothetical protein